MDATKPAANGKPKSLTELREERKTLEKKIELARLEGSRKLLENLSLWMDDFGGSDVWAQLRRTEGEGWVPLSVPSDRRHGTDWPLWRTITQLGEIRQKARILVKSNSFARGLLRNLTNYVIGKGFTYKAVPKQSLPDLPEEQQQDVQHIVDAVQDCVDDFCRRNRWNNTGADLRSAAAGHLKTVVNNTREREAYRRLLRDGEVFIRLFYAENGTVAVRFVDPECVQDPPGGTFSQGWMFGRQHQMMPFEDVETALNYFVWYKDPSTPAKTAEATEVGELVPANQIIHILSADEDSTVCRGTSEFAHETFAALNRASTLQRNISTGAMVRAATAEIWKHETGTAQQIQSMVDQFKEPGSSGPSSGRRYERERLDPGMIRRIPAGQAPVPTDPSAGVPNNMQAVQGDLRMAGTPWGAPEYLVSGSAENADYSSTKEAGAPFTHNTCAEQDHMKTGFLCVMALVVAHAVKCQRLDPRALSVVDIQVEAPAAIYRDELERAQADQIGVQNGWKSPQTCAMERGHDPEIELSNLEEYRERTQGGDGQELQLPGEDGSMPPPFGQDTSQSGQPGDTPQLPPPKPQPPKPPQQQQAPAAKSPHDPFEEALAFEEEMHLYTRLVEHLQSGSGRETVSKNIATEINAGKPRKQAIAIALSKAQEASDPKGGEFAKGGGRVNGKGGMPAPKAAPSAPPENKTAPTPTAAPASAPNAAGKAGVVNHLLGGAKVTAEHAKAAAAKVGQAAWNKLPPKAQTALAKTYAVSKAVEHKVMTGFQKSKELAVAVARERGYSPEAADRVGRILGTADLALAWTVNFPATTALTGSAIAGKVASWVPVASLSYIAASTASNPFATIRAAKSMIGKHAAPAHEALELNEAAVPDPDTVSRLLAGVQEHGDWYEALVYAALDRTQDLGQALDLADKAIAEQPDAPQGGEPDTELVECGGEGGKPGPCATARSKVPGPKDRENISASLSSTAAQSLYKLPGDHPARQEAEKTLQGDLTALRRGVGADGKRLSPEDYSAHEQRVHATIAKLDSHAATGPTSTSPAPAAPTTKDLAAKIGELGEGRNGFVDLVHLRQAFPEVPAPALNAAVEKAIREKVLTGSPYEGRHGITPEQKQAQFKPSWQDEHESPIGFLQAREALEEAAAVDTAALANVAPLTEEPDLLDVPDLRQETNYDCGADALRCVSRFFDMGSQDENAWVKGLETNPNDGTRPERIADVARLLGFDVDARDKMTVEDLMAATRAGRPVLICLQAYRDDPGTDYAGDWDDGHYVVVIGVGDGCVYFQDPSAGRDKLTFDALNARWHDVDADGNKLDHYGIVIGKPQASEAA